MPIKLDCPRCKKVLSIPSKKAGSYALCPNCNGRFWVPEDASQEKDVTPPPVVSASAGPAISPPKGMTGSNLAAPPGFTVPAGAPPVVIPVGSSPSATDAVTGSKVAFPPGRGAGTGGTASDIVHGGSSRVAVAESSRSACRCSQRGS